ncbi:MAG: 4Fe-4S binding protein [Chloroflexota bacterium]|nr:4Fe-4S binding protein [Chloroflexota bacterium]
MYKLERFLLQGGDVIQGNRRPAKPVPLIDPARCDGCGLCVRVCPTGALAVQDGLAVVAAPEACNYTGLCEAACPTGAIQRPFEIIISEKPGGHR